MHCPACVQRLTGAFENVPGVSAARVGLSPPRAELESTAPIPFETLALAARSAGDYSVSPEATANEPAATEIAENSKPSLYPLGLIILYIAGTAALATYIRGTADLHTFLNDFMAGFFLVFSFFKLLDLRGFAGTYRSYDIVAGLWGPWGFLYPFIELGLGVAYLVGWQPTTTNAVTLVLMLVGSAGVLRALRRKDAIRCACLGTALNLPMTTVTLVEDLAMALMAAAMLLWPH